MPLNYSKWDQLELSDDSDIEGHPNVDHKSLVRMRQRQIHEQREMRKYNIKNLTAQIACNEVLLPRIKKIHADLSSPPSSTPAPAYFNALVDQLQTNPSPDCPPGNDATKIEQTYDGMLLSLLKMVGEKSKDKVKEAGVLEADKEERLAKDLVAEMEVHIKQLGETIEKDKKDLASELAEQKKHITMDDLHEGFESHYVAPTPAPPPVPNKSLDKGKQKEKATTIEVLNPQSVETSSSSKAADDDAEEEGLPELTPSLEAFSKIPLWSYEKSFEFIQEHRDVYVPGASDALLVAAFTAQGEGKSKYAKQCVHQSLLIQYCEKLGRDGVGIFFKKMVSGDKRALKVFIDDVESTYKHLVERVRVNAEERKASEGREQIQLVPENPDQTISFNIPDGPPPENLVLEGPGTEGLDIEQVRRALQFRWDVYQSFPEELQEALKKGGLDDVNEVLGDMDVVEAEGLVNSLDAAGILNFAEGGIRDQTAEKKE
ncbi:hsp90-like protein [Pholiota conissans]|uniref:Hsp90 chaperone protein kinase-targeting subunit n=1 Tax=Pholiota conissans TaxID=109636 RepID=A0A9P5ZE78_9AGAR|nr:hsp90-like protein [Pholiota conissans]